MAIFLRSFATHLPVSLTSANDSNKHSKVGKFRVQLRCLSCLNWSMRCYHLSFPSSKTICPRDHKLITCNKDRRNGFNSKGKNNFLLWQINFIMPQAAIKVLQPSSIRVLLILNKGVLTCGSGPSLTLVKAVCKVSPSRERKHRVENGQPLSFSQVQCMTLCPLL